MGDAEVVSASVLNQLPKSTEGRIVLGGRPYTEQPSLSPGCVVYQVDGDSRQVDQMMSDLSARVEEKHEGWAFVKLSSDTGAKHHYALAFDPEVTGNGTTVTESLQDAASFCSVDDQGESTLVFLRAGAGSTNDEALQRLAFVCGKLHKAGHLGLAGTDEETTPHHSSRDGVFVFSLPKRERVYVAQAKAPPAIHTAESTLTIQDAKKEQVGITLHELTGPHGAVFVLEVPPDWAEGHNVAEQQAHDILNRALEELGKRHTDTNFRQLVTLPTTTITGGPTGEPHRLFVIATRVQGGSRRPAADLTIVSATMNRQFPDGTVALKDGILDVTIPAPMKREPFLVDVDLPRAMNTLYNVLRTVHGEPDLPTDLRVDSVGQGNAYRVYGDKRTFALRIRTI